MARPADALPPPAARLLALAGAYSAGVLAALALRPPWPAATAAAIVVLTAALGARWSRAAPLALLAAAAVLGLALAGLRLASLEEAALAAGAARGADAVLEGQVLGEPETAFGATRFVVGVSRAEIDGRAHVLRERALVSVRPPLRGTIRAGDRIRADTRLGPLAGEGADAAARRAAARLGDAGVAARAFARPDGVRRTGGSRSPLVRVARAARDAVRAAAARLPERERGLYLGVTIGDDSMLDPDVALDFRATGLSHLLAVSGANVAMVLAAVGFVLRRIGAGPRATLAALGATLVAFMATTQFEPSVLRAGAMAGLSLGAAIAGARREALTALGASSLGLLVYDPFLVRSAGFQLSALATLGILTAAPRIARVLPRGRVGKAAAVTLGAQAAVTPLLALTFHQLSLVALPANLLALPAVAPATVIGVAAAAAGAAWRPLGAMVLAVRPALEWMMGVARVFASLPLASVGTPSGAAGVAAAAALALAGLGLVRLRRLGPLVLAVTLVAATVTWTRALAPPPPRGLEIVALDVGQGDAILVRDPGGATMLVDGGPDPGRLASKLRAHGVRRLDVLALTHPHADHVEGLVPVAERYPIGRALDPGLAADLPAYDGYVRALARRGVARTIARAGMVLALGTATVRVLAPAEPLLEGTDSDLNNNSLVLRIEYGAAAVLLAGEVQEEGQERLLGRPGELRAAVVKVSHHGSARMLPDFYSATGAGYGVIPVGTNEFGHPAVATLEALARAGIRVLRTDRSGDVAVTLDGRGGAHVSVERRPAAA